MNTIREKIDAKKSLIRGLKRKMYAHIYGGFQGDQTTLDKINLEIDTVRKELADLIEQVGGEV